MAEIEAARIDPEDMGCGQRCFFTYGQMCERTAQVFGCCTNTYQNEMEREKRWEETVTLKEKVLRQRDHLVRLEKEQKQLTDRMIAFQTDSTHLIEETGEMIRKELKKAFRMEVDISTKELLRKHERLTQEQNGMNESIKSHGETLDNLGTTTSQIKQELKETFDRLQTVDEQLRLHENTSDVKFEEISVRIDYDDGAVARTLETLKEDNNTLQDLLANEQETNVEQNLDLVKLKEELEALKEGQAERDLTLIERVKKRADDYLDSSSDESEYSVDEEGNQKLDDNGKPKKRPKQKKGGMTEKVKRLLARDELSEGDLPDVPEEEPSDKAPYWEYMIHTPDEDETLSEYELRNERNEAICNEKEAEEKMEKRKMKKRAKRKKLAEQEKAMKHKSMKIAASGSGGAALPTHLTQEQ